MIVAPPVLDRWLRDAKAGETIVYARATYLIPNAVTRRLFALHQSGHVGLRRQRREHGNGDENFHYIAWRTAKQLPGPDGSLKVLGVRQMPPRKPQDCRKNARSHLQAEIAPMVRSLQAEGCRSGVAIARELGLYSPEPVYNLLRRMAA